MTTPAGGPGQDDLDRHVDRIIGAHRAAMQAIREQRKTLTHYEATELVTTVFTRRGVPVPRPEEARALARVSLDRFWVWKHPVTAYREGWFWSPSQPV